MNTKQLQNKLANHIKNIKARSAWQNGVKGYALDLLENIYQVPENKKHLQKMLLNNADNWLHYSESGMAKIYNRDIAITLCNNSELKKTDYGRKNPNKSENWLQVQYRALFQAERLILEAYEAL